MMKPAIEVHLAYDHILFPVTHTFDAKVKNKNKTKKRTAQKILKSLKTENSAIWLLPRRSTCRWGEEFRL